MSGLAPLPAHPERGWPVDPATGVVYGVGGRYAGKPIGSVRDTGYRGTTVQGRPYYLHRVVWEACVGPIPPGMVINHLNSDRLDNRLCNLEVVTPAENFRHMHRAGRYRGGAVSGPRNSNYKITPAMRASMSAMREAGTSRTIVARAYGVSTKAVWLIERGRTR